MFSTVRVSVLRRRFEVREHQHLASLAVSLVREFSNRAENHRAPNPADRTVIATRGFLPPSDPHRAALAALVQLSVEYAIQHEEQLRPEREMQEATSNLWVRPRTSVATRHSRSPARQA